MFNDGRSSVDPATGRGRREKHFEGRGGDPRDAAPPRRRCGRRRDSADAGRGGRHRAAGQRVAGRGRRSRERVLGRSRSRGRRALAPGAAVFPSGSRERGPRERDSRPRAGPARGERHLGHHRGPSATRLLRRPGLGPGATGRGCRGGRPRGAAEDAAAGRLRRRAGVPPPAGDAGGDRRRRPESCGRSRITCGSPGSGSRRAPRRGSTCCAPRCRSRRRARR